jgi:excisionase family DNA binding protein
MPNQPDPRLLPALPVPVELVDALADRIAERVADRLAPLRGTDSSEPQSPWLDFEGACAYLGFSRDSLYKLTAARAIPFRKKAGGQGLRFHRAELDDWMAQTFPRVDRLAPVELSSAVSPSSAPERP